MGTRQEENIKLKAFTTNLNLLVPHFMLPISQINNNLSELPIPLLRYMIKEKKKMLLKIKPLFDMRLIFLTRGPSKYIRDINFVCSDSSPLSDYSS